MCFIICKFTFLLRVGYFCRTLMFYLRIFICVTKCWIIWKFFFFLDCLRRTKGCELLILEYQNVVGTKLDWRYYHTYCRTLVHCLQIRNYYFTLVLCVWIYTCCHKLRNSNKYCGKIKKILNNCFPQIFGMNQSGSYYLH